MFQGLQKKVLLCLLCCFCQVVFERFCVTDDICTFSSNAGAPRRRPEDTMREEGREKFLWIRGAGSDLFCSVWNVKSLPGLKRTFGPGLIFFENRLTFRLNHFVSRKNSSPRRRTNCSTTRTLSFPPSSCCFPAKTTAPPALMLPAVTLQICCALIKQALRYWSSSRQSVEATRVQLPHKRRNTSNLWRPSYPFPKILRIHKFTSFALVKFVFSYPAIELVCGLKIYFWDQDPVSVLLQMYNRKLHGPRSENETKQVWVCHCVKGFVY